MIHPEMFTNKWPIRPLGEVVDFLDNLRRPVREDEREPGPYPYYGANGLQGTINDFIFDEPLVLLAEDGGFFGMPDKSVAYRIQGKCWVNNHAHVLRPKQFMDISFLCRQVETYDVTPFVSGTTRGKLTKGSAERIPILVPPLDEQRRIAAILDKTDAIRRKRQESIRLTEEFLRSAFLEMFGDPVTNPQGLRTGLLGDYCDMETGYAFKSEAFQKAGIKLCRGANVLPGELEWSDVKFWSNDAQIAERYVLREGDIVLAMDRPWISSGLKVARVNNADLPSYLVQRVARLRGIKGLSNEFIYWVIAF